MSIINNYNLDEILDYLCVYYKLEELQIWPSKKGMDNSVYFIGKNIKEILFVCKVIETKSMEEIKTSITLSTALTTFNNIRYLKTINGEVVERHPTIGKPIVIYEYIYGQELRINGLMDIIRYARFIGSFHSTYQKTKGNIEEQIQNEYDLIKLYWCEKLKEGVSKYFPERLKLYQNTIKLLDNFETALRYLKNFPCNMGVTHNDLTCDNIIVQHKHWSLIDFDAAKLHEFQAIDLFQAVSKSIISSSQRYKEIFLMIYYQEIKEPTKIGNKLLKSFNYWLIIFSLRAMLSTDYYTFCIPKLTPEWSRQNAASTFYQLEQTIIECQLALQKSDDIVIARL